MNCASPLKIYPKTELYRIDAQAYLNQYPLGYMEVPCGKCLSCRIARAREWSLRLMHELASWENAVFLTLTYSDEFMPKDKSIKKHDLQKFFKRLRKANHKIRYYACGEYGERYGRPHYHAIIFGLRADFDFTSFWPFGICYPGTVTYDSCRYVAQYIDKKYYGDMAHEKYLSKGLSVPFQICSQKLGLAYALSDQDRIKRDLYLTSRGKKCGIPRYYKKKLSLDSSLFRARSLDTLTDTFRQYVDKGYGLDEAFEDISLRRKQANANLKSKTELRKLQKLDQSL